MALKMRRELLIFGMKGLMVGLVLCLIFQFGRATGWHEATDEFCDIWKNITWAKFRRPEITEEQEKKDRQQWEALLDQLSEAEQGRRKGKVVAPQPDASE